MLHSALCTEAQLTSETFVRWAQRLRPAWDHSGSSEPVALHRKVWEWIFIAQALHERGMLAPGKRGVGFGVGQEPLAALLASHGCEIVATDLPASTADGRGWVETGQHASALEHLNAIGLCPADEFAARVSFRPVDMNDIPADLRDFDFCWSSCAFEHLGTIELGQRFVRRAQRCLRPGGIAVHTTEFNVSSDLDTVEAGGTVLYRRRDIEWLAGRLRDDGHLIDVDYDAGDRPADHHVDAPPWSPVHLKIELARYVATSLGLIVEHGPMPSPADGDLAALADGPPARRWWARKLRKLGGALRRR